MNFSFLGDYKIMVILVKSKIEYVKNRKYEEVRIIKRTDRGALALIVDGKKAFARGKLYEFKDAKTIEEAKKNFVFETKILPKGKAMNITCIGNTNKKRYVLFGEIKFALEKNKRGGVDGSRNISDSSLDKAVSKEILYELDSIVAARKSGLDVYTKLQMVCFITGESRASIYRKMKTGAFPSGVKRGKGRFWLVDEIERYKAGNFNARIDDSMH